ncbi:MAG: hypothetical protein K2W95_15795 [Candidatus Obscuribacterales bacterium]|nr:hypothetical protein [Candidatus Obscuribacterales bacterium]
MGMLQNMAAKQLTDFVDNADLNKDGIKDKGQIEAIASKGGKAVEDLYESVDWSAAGPAFEEISKNAKQVLSVFNPDLVKDHNVDIAQLLSELNKPATRQAAGVILYNAMVLFNSVDEAKFQVAVKELGEVKVSVEAFIHPAPAKKK